MQERKEQEKRCDVEIDPDKIRILLRFVDPDGFKTAKTTTNKRMKFRVFKISLEDRRLP